MGSLRTFTAGVVTGLFAAAIGQELQSPPMSARGRARSLGFLITFALVSGAMSPVNTGIQTATRFFHRMR